LETRSLHHKASHPSVLILWFVQVGGLEGRLLWFGLGLVFSLAGDIFLMLPSRFFIAGLIAFLLGHVFYIFGFDPIPLPMQWGTLLALAVVLGAGFFIIRSATRGMRSQPGSETTHPTGANLRTGDWADALCCPADTDAARMAHAGCNVCQRWRGAIFCIGFHPGPQSLRETHPLR
jgi:hypothetical protein